MFESIFTFFSHLFNLFLCHFRDYKIGAARSGSWPQLEHSFKSKNMTCAACGTGVRIQIHHEKPFHLHPELELDVNNLISLCMGPKECHLKIGHGGSFRAYNPNVRSDAAEILNDDSMSDSVVVRARTNRLFE